MIDVQCLLPLVESRYSHLIRDYMLYMTLGETHFMRSALSAEIKKEQIELLKKAILRDFPMQGSFLYRLQKAFVRENLSLYLLLDALQGWRYWISEKNLSGERRFTEICGYMLSPLARLLMALHDETPSTYLPMSSLLVCLYQLEMWSAGDELQKRIKISKRNKINKLNGLIENSKVILQIVNSKRLKFRLAMLLNSMQIKIRKIEKNEQLEIGILDGWRIFLYSVFQFMIIRKRTVYKKGI